MQYNQIYCNGFPNCGQYNCNEIIPFTSIIPEIIGEGEVISVTLPDGSLQFLFVATGPLIFSPQNTNCYPVFNKNRPAWHIKSFPNQPPVPLLISQPIQQLLQYYLQQSVSSNCNMCPPGFQLKFHSDKCSSTTDLHYFIPKSRVCDWSNSQKCNAVTQVEIPGLTNPFFQYKVVCDNPCNCFLQVKKQEPRVLECRCSMGSQEDYTMSVDSNSDERPACCVGNIVYVNETLKCTSHGDTKVNKNVNCECKVHKNTSERHNKPIKTFAEQSNGCAVNVSCGTCEHSGLTDKLNKTVAYEEDSVKPEIWQPKTPLSKKYMRTKSSETLAQNSTSCCSDNGS